MIKLIKQQCPEIIRQSKETWTKELLKAKENGEDISKFNKNYKRPEIKDALKQDASNKCMYCESKVSPTYYGDIEHIKPKSKYPELTFEWDNLGFACRLCNNIKRDKYEEDNPIINPFKENPLDFFDPIGAYIYPKKGNSRGKITEETVELNRPDLLEQRRDEFNQIKKLVKIMNSRPGDLELRQVIIENIKERCTSDKQYSMCLNSFYKTIVQT